MPKYLLEVSYTHEGAKGLLAKGGSARLDAARSAAEAVGGTIESFHFAFGPVDVYAIVDLPDAATAAALALTVSGSGAARVNTIVLMAAEDVDAASGMSVPYFPPGS